MTGLVRTLLRAAPLTGLLVAVTVALAAFGAAGADAWFRAAADATLPRLLAEVPPAQRGLEFEQSARTDATSGDPVARLATTGDALAADLPAPVAALVSERTDLVDSPEYQVLATSLTVSRVALRAEPWAETAVRYVEGRAPTGSVTEVAPPEDTTRDPRLNVPTPVLEVAVSTATATQLGLGVGDRVQLVPATSRYGAILVDVVGTFEVTDPDDPRWFGDTTLERPFRTQVELDTFVFHGTALLAPGALPTLTAAAARIEADLPLRYRWRFGVDPARATSVDIDGLVAAMTRLGARYPFGGGAGLAGGDRPGLSSRVTELFDAYRLQRQAAGTAFALAVAGPVAAAIGLLGLIAAAVARQRRVAVAVLRARGAGAGRLLVAGALAALGLVAAPAVVGALVASPLVTGRADPTAALRVAGVVGVVAAVLLVAAGLPALGGAPSVAAAERTAPAAPAARRRVLDLLVLAVAGLGVASLRSGGVTTAEGGLDPLAAAAPILVAVAGGLVVLRLLALVVGLLARLAAWRPGFGAVHAFRSLARRASRLDLPLVVLVVAITTGIVSTSVARTLDHAQAAQAMTAVGADWRVEATGARGFPEGFDVAPLGALGPIAVAGGTDGNLSGVHLAARSITVIGLDPAAYAGVVRDTPAETGFASDLSAAAAAQGDPGEAVASLPIVIPADLADITRAGPGSQLSLRIGETTRFAVVRAVEPSFPGLPDDAVVLPLGALQGAVPDLRLTPLVAYLRAGPDAEAAISAAVAPYGGQLAVTSAEARLRALHDAPLVATMRDGFALALLVAPALAALVVAAAFVQALALRTREVALLRALGLGARGALGPPAAELATTIVVAGLAGLALGIGIAWLAVPALGLERFAGTATAAVTVLDPIGILVAVAAPPIASLAVIAPVLLLTRALDVPVVLRTGAA